VARSNYGIGIATKKLQGQSLAVQLSFNNFGQTVHTHTSVTVTKQYDLLLDQGQ